MKVYLRLKQRVTQDQLKEILDIVKDIPSAVIIWTMFAPVAF